MPTGEKILLKSKNFILMASGNGSNAQVLAERAIAQDYPLKGLVTDKENAPVIEKMKSLKILERVIANHPTIGYTPICC